MPRLRSLIVAVVLVAAAACGSSEARIGPLTLVPPEGWLVTAREPSSIKVTNGTIADDTSTKPGTATAVFDVYVESDQTPAEFRKAQRKNNLELTQEDVEIDGYDGVIVSWEPSGADPQMEVVFVPEWEVRIVYRAAYPDEQSAFDRHRDEFRAALDSIRFEGRPPRRA